jgi:hypothetical protein
VPEAHYPTQLPEQLIDEIEHGGPGADLQSSEVDLEPVFSWKLSFCWEDDDIFFDGERLDRRKGGTSWSQVSTAGSEDSGGPEESIAGSGGSIAGSISSIGACFQVSLPGYPAPHPDGDAPSKALYSGMVSHILHDAQETLIRRLDDHYWRTYHPQESSKRSGKKGSKVIGQSRHAPYRRTAANQQSSKSKPSRRRKLTDGCGNSEDEDDGDDDKGGDRQTQKSKGPSRRFACPFAKWRPQKFQCGLKFKEISHMKDHLKKKHYLVHCQLCFSVFGSEDDLTCHNAYPCIRRCPDTLSFLTKDKFETIMKRADQSKTHEEQWEYIFRVLFPNEPSRPSPYWEEASIEQQRYLWRYIRTEGRAQVHELWPEIESEFSAVQFDVNKEQFINATFDKWLERTMQKYRSDEEFNSGTLFDQPSLSDSSPTKSACETPGVDAERAEQGTFALESNPGQLTQSTACLQQFSMTGSHLHSGSGQPVHGGNDNNAPPSYVDESGELLDSFWTTGLKDPAAASIQSFGCYPNIWDFSANFHAPFVESQHRFNEPVGSAFPTQQGNLINDAGQFLAPGFPIGDFSTSTTLVMNETDGEMCDDIMADWGRRGTTSMAGWDRSRISWPVSTVEGQLMSKDS